MYLLNRYSEDDGEKKNKNKDTTFCHCAIRPLK